MLNTKKIEKAMEKGKITKTKLCGDTGIARSTLDAILNGSDAKISTIEIIAAYLGVKLSYLFDEEGEGKTNVTANDHSQAAGRDLHIGTSGAGVEDAVMAERVKYLEALVNEKDERISELKERISELKAKQ